MRFCQLRYVGLMGVQVQRMVTELEAALHDAQQHKQRLLDANAAIQLELGSQREMQQSAEARVGLLLHPDTCGLKAHGREEQ